MTVVSYAVKPRLLFVVTEDWYFCSHRMPIAVAAIEAGFDVSLATRVSQHGDVIRACGIDLHEWEVSRGSTGIFAELRTLYKLFRIFLKVKPIIVHQVALKPVLYGSFLAKLTGIPAIVNALGGMGSIFTAGTRRKRLLKAAILNIFRLLLSKKGGIFILQNPDDQDLMVEQAGIDLKRIRLIRGAGVNLDNFSVVPESVGLPLIVLPARMLWDKGIGEFVEASRILKAEGIQARFALVGGTDECNPSAIDKEQLAKWNAEGLIEWFGMRSDMPSVLQSANIVCLPSYREGLPKALLEAAACARAIVSTDVPGCREIVRDGENGILVPPQDPVALSAALKKLILSPELRRKMGQRGREMANTEFSEQIVVAQTINIYSELLAAGKAAPPVVPQNIPGVPR